MAKKLHKRLQRVEYHKRFNSGERATVGKVKQKDRKSRRIVYP